MNNAAIDIYFKNTDSWKEVYFYLFNSKDGKENKKWPGVKAAETIEKNVYSMRINTSEFDRIVFNDGKKRQTMDVMLSSASSGFSLSRMDDHKKVYYVENYAVKGQGMGKLYKTKLKYKTTGKTGDYDKQIWVWTPAGYSEKNKPYKTIYIMDGQNLFDGESQDYFGGWRVTDAVEALMYNGGEPAIIVGIDNSKGFRDSELTPHISAEVDRERDVFFELTGEIFGAFVTEEVMKYVQNNFNSSSKKEDNAIAGASSGGLEAFYIGITYPEKFSSICALSPAFLLFNYDHWTAYFTKHDLTEKNMPRLYIYTGKGDYETDIYPNVLMVEKILESENYKYGNILITALDERAAHNEACWRNSFMEYLGRCF